MELGAGRLLQLTDDMQWIVWDAQLWREGRRSVLSNFLAMSVSFQVFPCSAWNIRHPNHHSHSHKPWLMAHDTLPKLLSKVLMYEYQKQ